MTIEQFPSATDQLFATATDARNEACLNYFPNGWAFYAMGYKDAADTVVADFVKTTHRRNPLAYPIVFLYRQYLELTLKDLVQQAWRYFESIEEFPKTHRLDDLWHLLRRLVEEMGCSGGDEMQQIERLIGEFCAIDPSSQAFRYPEDRQGNPS